MDDDLYNYLDWGQYIAQRARDASVDRVSDLNSCPEPFIWDFTIFVFSDVTTNHQITSACVEKKSRIPSLPATRCRCHAHHVINHLLYHHEENKFGR